MRIFTGVVCTTLLSFSLTGGSFELQVQAKASEASQTVFKEIDVFDGHKLIKNTHVWVQGSQIKQVGKLPETLPKDVRWISGQGKTMLPGLIDAHTHITSTQDLKRALLFGVTTELDMFSQPPLIQFIRNYYGQSPDLASFLSAGILATAPKGHGTEYGIEIPTLTRPEEVPGFVKDRIAEGSNYIKIVYDNYHAYGYHWPTLSLSTVSTLVQEAHKHNKKALVHIGSVQEALDALEAQADGLVHLSAQNRYDPRLIQQAKASQAFVTPTLSVLQSITNLSPGKPLLHSYLLPFLNPIETHQLGLNISSNPSSNLNYAMAQRYTQELYKAGVPLMAGTDSPNPGVVHGASMHRELQLLEEAGLPPIEALKSATSVPARVFKLPSKGCIAPGCDADLLVVEGSPTQYIAHTQRITGVWKMGKEVQRLSEGKYEELEKQHLAEGLVQDFKIPAQEALWGAGLAPNTDHIFGGHSSIQAQWQREGAPQNPGSVLLKGEVKKSHLTYPWAGFGFYPGRVARAPKNLNHKTTLSFWAKGDNKSYLLALVSGRNHQHFVPFDSSPQWQKYRFELSDIKGLDLSSVSWIGVSSGMIGPFELALDEIRLD